MRKGALAAAVGVLAVVCSACSGSSHSSAVRHPGTTSLGPGGTASGSVSLSPATAPAAPGPEAAGSGASWTAYHGNAEATGVQDAQIKLLPSRRTWTSPILDGQLYGEPLVADGRIVAATENDTVYVMAARSGHILWSRHRANLAEEHALTMPALAQELSYRLPRRRLLPGRKTADSRSCRFVSRRRA